MRAILAATAVLGALLAPSPSLAGVLKVERVQINQGDESGRFEWRAAFDAAPGEANVVTLTRERGVWTLRDDAADIALPDASPCTRAGARAVTCPVKPDAQTLRLDVTHVRLGDGDDRFETAEDTFEFAGRILGGPGNDTLSAASSRDRAFMDGEGGDDVLTGSGDATASLAADELTGGPGNDTLTGGGGDDTLVGDGQSTDANGTDRLDGGAGEDTLTGDGSAAPAADRLVGGTGADMVSYAAATRSVGVDLASRSLAGAAVGDVLEGIEGVEGSPFADRLTGDGAANRLYGGEGEDRIAGGAGRDTLWGEDGRDTLRGDAGADDIAGDDGADDMAGGAGDDLINADDSNPRADTVRCGSGRDRVHEPDDSQTIAPDCEGVSVANGAVVARTIRVGRAGVTLGIRGTRFSATASPVGFTVRDAQGRVLARRAPRVLIAGTHAVALVPTARGRRVLLDTETALFVHDDNDASWRPAVRRGDTRGSASRGWSATARRASRSSWPGTWR